MRSAVILALSICVLGCAVGADDSQPAAQAANANRIGGTVLETIDVSSYTYVRFETPAGAEVWAAVPLVQLEVGAQVVIASPQAMSNFESKTLGRTFDTIYFGSLEDQNPSAPIKLAKATGANSRTIAELYAESGTLAGKTVALRGQVVKFNGSIMGRNWIHLQDGTGDATAGTDDIVVTTSDTTAVGDIILIQGTVAVDKDFGSGYRYDVIVEDASVKTGD